MAWIGLKRVGVDLRSPGFFLAWRLGHHFMVGTITSTLDSYVLHEPRLPITLRIIVITTEAPRQSSAFTRLGEAPPDRLKAEL